MKKKYSNYIIIIILGLFFFLPACNSNKIEQYYQSDLNIIKSEFPVDLLNHFPEKVNEFYKFKTIFPVVCKTNGRCGIILITKNNQVTIDSLIKKSIQKIKVNRKCNLIVNTFSNEQLMEKIQYCDSLSYPVPDILNIILSASDIDNNIKNNIDENINLYILDSKPGEFIKQEYLSNGIGLPSKWRNGYSSGIAINGARNIVIYWLEIW